MMGWWPSWGSCKHHHSDLFQRSMILLMALTANQGRPGTGMRVAAWWGLDGLDKMAGSRLGWSDMLRVIPKAMRGLTPRDYEQLFTEHSEKAPNTPLMPFLYVHGGYKELWSRPELADPMLPRGLDEYMRLSIERGWTKIHPKPGRRPRVFIFTGSNPLRRWPAPQYTKQHLWPKFVCIVAVNFRMSTSALHAELASDDLERQLDGILEPLSFELERRHGDTLLEVSMSLERTYFPTQRK